MHKPDNAPATRLYFLDWARIIAFFILIVYHVGMYYVTWDWHVKSPNASTGPEPFMLMSGPWRLSLLFLISGVASSFMLTRTRISSFLRQRTVRLVVPLLFGMLVVVPPQPYFEVIEKLGYAGSYAEFMGRYIHGYHGFCKDGCLILPTWNHLWFVAYLWIYTLGLAALVAVMGTRFHALASRLGPLLVGWRIIVLPFVVLAVIRVTLAARFPENHAVVGDWYNHANYFFVFVLGALLAQAPQFWARVERLRWHCLGLAAAGWVATVCWWAFPHQLVPAELMEAFHALMRSLVAMFAWTAILTAIGFSHRHLQRDGAARRYLTEAVFPVYIAHQTLIVVAAHALKPLHLSPTAEAPMLAIVALSGSFGLFELVRRVPVLRPLFGLSYKARDTVSQAAPELVATRAA